MNNLILRLRAASRIATNAKESTPRCRGVLSGLGRHRSRRLEVISLFRCEKGRRFRGEDAGGVIDARGVNEKPHELRRYARERRLPE